MSNRFTVLKVPCAKSLTNGATKADVISTRNRKTF